MSDPKRCLECARLAAARDTCMEELGRVTVLLDEARASLARETEESTERLQALATATEIAREFERRMTEARRVSLTHEKTIGVVREHLANVEAECARLHAEGEAAAKNATRMLALVVEAAGGRVEVSHLAMLTDDWTLTQSSEYGGVVFVTRRAALRPSPAPSPVESAADIAHDERVARSLAPIPKEEAPRPRCSPDQIGEPCPTAKSCAWHGDPVMCSASRAPAPAATGLPQEGPGDEDDLPESALCSACKGDGLQAHPGCSGCLACDGPCSTCGGTGRSPDTTGGGK